MKKIYLFITLVATVLLNSCDMDLAPIGTLDDESAIESVTDLKKARNGIYNNLRYFVTGPYMYYTDIQMDQFMGLTINGNQNGSFAHGNILSGNSEIEDVWASCYGYIANANYLLKHADALVAKGNLDGDELLEVKRYVAETKFARAYYYAYLVDHWCVPYTAAAANAQASGVPLVTVFNPTGDIETYPGRSTLAESYALIDQDLEDAYTDLKEFETATNYDMQPMSAYINSNTVIALQARLALLRQDWTTAINKANQLINSGVYTLANTNNYDNLWANDTSNELIFRPYSINTELGVYSTGGAYISSTPTQAYYIPTFENLLLYDDGDVRFDSFFNVRGLLIEGSQEPAYCFNKYPGNIELRTGTGTNNLMHMGKPFRLSETYLILAEAANEAGDPTTANAALNTLRKNRIIGYTETSYSDIELVQEIRDERSRELIGEGFRFSDLRRWGLGFVRDSSYPINPQLENAFVVVDTQVEYIAGDHRYTWPIPTTEMENNPQLKGQQNPGY